MSDRSFMRHPMARGLALVLSVSLGAFVVLNAQFGCDSPASNPPPKDAAPSEPEPSPKPEPKPELPAKPDSEARAEEQPNAQPAPNPAPQPDKEPVFMPASKSGGDFGSMHFPGEPSPSQQQQQLQQNPEAPPQ